MKHGTRMTRSGWLWAVPLAALLVSGAGLAAGARTYKWTDEKGEVHYSDHLPSEPIKKDTAVLDKQGRTVKKIEPGATEEQRKAKEADAELQREIARQQQGKERKDRAVTQSYLNEEEIDLARNRAMSRIGEQLRAAESYSTQLIKRQSELENKKVEYGKKPVPVAIDRELSNIRDELERQSTLIGQKKQQLAAVAAKYDADKQRWREIKGEQQKSQAQNAAGSAAAPATARPATTR